MTIRKNWLLMMIGLLMTLALAGCGGEPQNQLTVLAGSELQDLEPLLPQIEQETGIRLQMEYIGTLDGAEKLAAGENVDLAWFSHGKYLNLLEDTKGRLVAQEKIMLSPVVLGLKESKVDALGWRDKIANSELTWHDIAAQAESGELRYAMTNPASSNSGFTALVGVAAALSGSGDALEISDIDGAGLQAFFKGQVVTAGSSSWLAERYVDEQAQLDGMINYESVLLALNEGNQLQEKLVLIYPQEGIITADYPLMLINGDKREEYDKLISYLRDTPFQEEMMRRTLRRPVNSQVPLSDKFPSQLLIELPFPNSLEVVNHLLFAYLDEQRIPSHAFFVLDVSGSMDGDGITQLKNALNNLTGSDQSLTGQFARFRGRERLTMIPFNDQVQNVSDFTITDTSSQGESMQQIRTYVDGLYADGGTAIFSSLQKAYELAAQAQQNDPSAYYSIVLMSDGQNTDGINQQAFMAYYNSLPDEVRGIRTFTILFGDADERTMSTMANTTGGRMFDAKSESLDFIFKQIRGYQ